MILVAYNNYVKAFITVKVINRLKTSNTKKDREHNFQSWNFIKRCYFILSSYFNSLSLQVLCGPQFLLSDRDFIKPPSNENRYKFQLHHSNLISCFAKGLLVQCEKITALLCSVVLGWKAFPLQECLVQC